MAEKYYRCTDRAVCGYVWIARGKLPPVKCPRCQRVRPIKATQRLYLAYRAEIERKRSAT